MWEMLSIEATTDEKLIKKAYSRKLKEIDQETQSDLFMSLRSAYDNALQWARHSDYFYDEDESDEYIEDSVEESDSHIHFTNEVIDRMRAFETKSEEPISYFETLEDHLSKFIFRMNVNAWNDYYLIRDIFDYELIENDLMCLIDFVESNPALPKSVWTFIRNYLEDRLTHLTLYSKSNAKRIESCIQKATVRMHHSYIQEIDVTEDAERLEYFEMVLDKMNDVNVKLENLANKGAESVIQELETVHCYDHEYFDLLKLYANSMTNRRIQLNSATKTLLKRPNCDEDMKVRIFDIGLQRNLFELCNDVIEKLNRKENRNLEVILKLRLLIKKESLIKTIMICNKFKSISRFNTLELETLEKMNFEFTNSYSDNIKKLQFRYIVKALAVHHESFSNIQAIKENQPKLIFYIWNALNGALPFCFRLFAYILLVSIVACFSPTYAMLVALFVFYNFVYYKYID